MNFEESIILYYCEKYDVRPSEVREELDKINENLREIVELRESKKNLWQQKPGARETEKMLEL